MDDGFGNLGFYTLGCVYLTSGITSLFSGAMFNRLGVKLCLLIAGTTNTLWILTMIFAAIKHEYPDIDSVVVKAPFVYTISIIVSLINGAGVTLTTVAQGNYISNCATEETKGLFFSIFWAFYMGAQVFGNLIASQIMGNLDQIYFLIIMVSITILATISFAFLKKPT